MLPPAALHAADRIVTILMTLIEAVGGIAIATIRTPSPTPTILDHAAPTLFHRLFNLITTLIRISALGIRRPREPDPATPSRTPAALPIRRDGAPGLPRRPGWLLAAMPDIAPGVAADLGLLLADPTFATLLGSAPSLHRLLRPLLRSLGLTATQSPNAPPPQVPPPRARPIAPHPATPPPATPIHRVEIALPALAASRPYCYDIVTITVTPPEPPPAPHAAWPPTPAPPTPARTRSSATSSA